MAQQLKAAAAFAEDLGWVPSNCMSAQIQRSPLASVDTIHTLSNVQEDKEKTDKWAMKLS